MDENYKVCKNHLKNYIRWLNNNKEEESAQLHPGQRIAIKVLRKFWNEYDDESYKHLLSLESYHQDINVNSRNTDMWSKYIMSVTKLTNYHTEQERNKHAECEGDCTSDHDYSNHTNPPDQPDGVARYECEECVPGSCKHINLFDKLRREYLEEYKNKFKLDMQNIKTEYNRKEAIVDLAKQ